MDVRPGVGAAVGRPSLDAVDDGRNISYCAAKWGQFSLQKSVNLARTYQLYLVIVQYFLPLIIISYAYIRIMRKVWMSNAPGAAMDTRDQIMNRNKTKVSRSVGRSVCALPCFVAVPVSRRL